LDEIRTAKELEEFGRRRFQNYFDRFQVEVFCESENRGSFRISQEIYSPEPDIAVGPFATGDKHFEGEYDEMALHSRMFIEGCISKHKVNAKNVGFTIAFPSFGSFYGSTAVNSNARCFIAMEIERTGTSRKHKLGSTVNAIALGRIGILLGFDNASTRIFLRALKYLDFLNTVKKLNIDFRNGLVLSKEQFEEVIRGI